MLMLRISDGATAADASPLPTQALSLALFLSPTSPIPSLLPWTVIHS